MNFLTNSNLRPYKTELRKTILYFLGVVFLCSLFVISFEAKRATSSIIEKFNQDQELVLRDFKKLSFYYKRQISFIAEIQILNIGCLPCNLETPNLAARSSKL